jgi:Na+-translocating ferredoxin:NAD+ oxidoreductase RnfC subunit
LELFEALKSIFGFEQISMGVHEKDREWFAPYAEHADGVFDMRYVPNTYALGEEKTLVKHATETRVPRFVDTPDGMRRPGMPPDVGKVINNSETLLNVYNALFLGRPLTTKFFTVYGEEVETKGLRGAYRRIRQRGARHRGRRRREFGPPLGSGRRDPTFTTWRSRSLEKATPTCAG